MAKPWKDVYGNGDFQSLNIEERQQVQERYFETIVKPQVPLEDIEKVRTRFNDHAESIRVTEDKSFEWLGNIAFNFKPTLKRASGKLISKPLKLAEKTGLSKLVGTAIGTVNAPLAAYWGLWEARHIDPEQYQKLPFMDQMKVSLGSALHSGWRSMTGKGDWGTMYGEYFKTVNKQTITEALPKNLKWMGTTLEVAANIISDPIIAGGTAKNIIDALTKNNLKELSKLGIAIPKGMSDDLAKIATDEQAKKILVGRLTSAMNQRKGYMQFAENAFDKIRAGQGIKHSFGSIKQAKEFGAQTVAKHPNGLPRLFYHGTIAPDDFIKLEVTNDLGIHLGTLDAANTRIIGTTVNLTVMDAKESAKLAKSLGIKEVTSTAWGREFLRNAPVSEVLKPRIMPYYVKLKNPVVMPDMGSWSPNNVITQLNSQGVLNADEANKLYALMRKTELSRDQYPLIVKAIKSKGYDGILYANEFEKGIAPKSVQSLIIFPDDIASKLKPAYTNDLGYSPFSPELAGQLGFKKLPITPKGFTLKPTVEPSLSSKLAALSGKPEQIATIQKISTTPKTERQLIDLIIQDAVGNKMTEATGLMKVALKHKRQHKAFKTLIVASEKEKKQALEFAHKALALGDKRVNAPIKKALGNVYNPKARVTLQASGGSIAGIEQDEGGNIKYNVGKGIAGMLLATGGMKLSAKKANSFKTLLKKNPAWAKVANMVGTEVPQSSKFLGLWGRINTALFNKFAVLNKVSPTAKREAEVFTSYLDASKLKFGDLVDGLSKIKNEEVPFTHYMLAKRSAERAQRGLLNPNGVTYADAMQSIQEIETYLKLKSGQKGVDQFREAAENFYKWSQKNILDDGLQGGILSKASVEGTLAKNKNYIAFDVLEHIPDSLHNLPVLKSKQLFSVSNQNVLKAMKGTEKQIGNPIEATIKKFMDMQNLVARNKVASTLIDDPQAQRWIKPVATTADEFNVMLSKGLEPVMLDTWNPKFFDSLNRLKDGNLERYVVPKEIADVMKRITPVQANKVIASFNSVFKKGATTMYLPFTITNAFRDSLMAYTTSPVFTTGRPEKFAMAWTKGFWNGFKHEMGMHSDLATLYLQEGGGFGYVGSLRQFKAAKQDLFKKGLLKKGVESPVTNPFKLIEKVSTTIELAPRLGTFDTALAKGYKPREAALLARKATIDFSISGTFTQMANLYVPFLNANIQAKAILAEALVKRPQQTLAKITTAVMLPATASYAWNRIYHSKLYDDIPQNIKDNYFITIIGEDKDKYGKRVPKYLTIPKGDVGQLAWNPMEFVLDKMYKEDPEKLMPFLVSYLSDLSPIPLEKGGQLSPSRMVGGLIPPVIKGGVESITGHKFYWDGPIIPKHMEKLPSHLQYTELTPKAYKWMAKKFGGSPLHYQNMAGNLLAGYGREGLDPSAMLRGLTGRLVKTRGGEIQSQVWETIEDIDRGYFYVRAEAAELVKHNKRVAARKLLQQWNRQLNPRLDEFDKRFEKHGYKDRGGLTTSYRFTVEKMRNILSPYQSRFTPLEKRLKKGAK